MILSVERVERYYERRVCTARVTIRKCNVKPKRPCERVLTLEGVCFLLNYPRHRRALRLASEVLLFHKQSDQGASFSLGLVYREVETKSRHVD